MEDTSCNEGGKNEENWIEQKIVAKVNEPKVWISSIAVVKRPQSNQLCICIDLCHLNQALERPCYPQPTTEDILPQLSKAKAFPCLMQKTDFGK